MTAAAPAPGWSLRRRLLGLLALFSTILLTGSAALFYLDARDASQKLFDGALRESAALILQLAQHEIEEHGPELGVTLMYAETRAAPFAFRYQIWTRDMRSAYSSANLPTTPLMPLTTEGFDWATVNGQRWRAYSTWNASHTLQIQIVQSLSDRKALANETLTRLIVATVSLLLLALGSMAWILTLTFRPLRWTARLVADRSPDDLQPVDARDSPREVRPLLTALNQLLSRVRDTLSAERRFTADASHELRTPLAAIRANAQVLLAARDTTERERTAKDLLASVDRGTRLIEQLLAMARADAQAGVSVHDFVALDDLARAQQLEQADTAARKGVALQLDAQPARVRGIASLLAALARNLVDNAIRYTPPGGTVRVDTLQHHDEAHVSVSDTGPGIAPQDRERIFERFYRVPGSDQPGSGLGLSIVRRIAELHAAQIDIEVGAGGRGTRITVRFKAT
jgi:two-component system, OmpR family, sensor histidine kinase QseC